MKRVIEIEEDRYDVLQKLEKATHGTGYMNYFEETIANSKPLNEVLDAIRTEIEAIEEGITSYHNDRPWIFKDEALQIIDKYKESEGV